MSRITIKIVDIDRAANNIIVKYASDASAKSIDEYSAMGFQITDPRITTPEQFIDSIRYQLSQYVAVRDAFESHVAEIDFSMWNNFTTEVESIDLVDPVLQSQIIAAHVNPEVTL
jgi:hypothetical protein